MQSAYSTIMGVSPILPTQKATRKKKCGCGPTSVASAYEQVSGEYGCGLGSQFEAAFLESDLGANFFEELADKAGKGIKKLGDKIGDAGRNVGKKVSKGFKTLSAKAVAATMKLIAEGKAKFKWLTEKIAAGIKAAWNALVKLGKKLLAFLKKLIGDIWKAFLRLIIKLAQAAGLVKKDSGLKGFDDDYVSPGGAMGALFDNLKGKGQTTGKEIECAFKTHFESDSTKQEVIMTGIAGVGAGIVTGGAAAAGVAGASVARHGGAIVAKALTGGNCGGGEGNDGGGGGGGEGMSGKVIAGLGIAAIVAMVALSKTPQKPKPLDPKKQDNVEEQKTEIKEPAKNKDFEPLAKVSVTA